ncbi:MAG: DUF924 domain-containing protein [SAR324 cluster bacterium]|nr:DUF924 domain-containing protein [SAR324 cluster bacterium]
MGESDRESGGAEAPPPSNPQSPVGVLRFWFALERPGKKDDGRVRAALEAHYEQARDGRLIGWAAAPRPRLALVLLLDQVPRHLFRERPEAFSTDPQAQVLTGRFVEREDWHGFAPLERYYAAVPWMHAEDEALQRRVNPLIHALAAGDASLAVSAGIADLYWETIRRFGRFPHRNAVLGRDSTPEELVFLEGEWPRRKRAVYAALEENGEEV